MTLNERMFALLEEQKLQQSDLAKYLNVTNSVITSWKKRGNNPPSKYLVKICDFLNISLNDLLGVERNADENKNGTLYNMNDIGERIKERRKELNLTQNEIYEQCGIASGALSQIENGTRIPSVLIFFKLAQTLQCTVEWLITGESTNKFINENEFEMLWYFKYLPEREQIKWIGRLEDAAKPYMNETEEEKRKRKI